MVVGYCQQAALFSVPSAWAAGGQLQLIRGGCGHRVPSSGQSGGVLAWLGEECSITLGDLEGDHASQISGPRGPGM